METELRKEPTANEGTSDSDEKVADNPEPGALHNLTGQPSGNEADHQYDQEAFTRHVHFSYLQLHEQADEFALALEMQVPPARAGVAESENSLLQAEWESLSLD